MKHREFYWYKLDNAAKIFPSVSSENATNVFRMTARLFENIVPELLQNAVERALEEMPTFRVKLHKGVFWYYFETNFNKPVVKKEYTYPCSRIDRQTNNAFLFDVTYYGKNINLDIFHAISDGTGATEFLKRIIGYYLSLLYPEKVSTCRLMSEASSDIAKSEDSFMRVSKEAKMKSKSLVRPKCYNINSILTINNEIKVIKGVMPASQICAIAKEKGVTVTALLASVLIYSIYMEDFRYYPKNKSIQICVPVNLRSIFGSDTSRNFFTTITLGINFFNNEYSLDDVIKAVSDELTNQIKKENLHSLLKFGVEMQEKPYLRFLPLFIKNIGLKIAFAKGEKGFTTVLSNLGRITLHESLEPFVERFELLMSPTLGNHIKTSVCSYKDNLVYCFTSNSEDTDIQKRFFTTFVKMGAEVTISTNECTDDSEDKDGEKYESLQ